MPLTNKITHFLLSIINQSQLFSSVSDSFSCSSVYIAPFFDVHLNLNDGKTLEQVGANGCLPRTQISRGTQSITFLFVYFLMF